MVVEGVYIVKSIANFFLVTVKKDEEDEYIISLLPTPSKDHPLCAEGACVQVMTFGDDQKHYLAQLKYHPSCSLGGGLEKGSGTEEMLMCTLGFCYALFVQEGASPSIPFGLIDASIIHCDNHAVSLRDYEMLVRGKTWYQRKFYATTQDPVDQIHLDEMLTTLADTRFDEHDYKALETILAKRMTVELRDKYVEIMRESFTRKDSWQKMIEKIDAGDTRGCSFFFDDVVDYIKRTLGLRNVTKFTIEMTRARSDLYVDHYELVHAC